MNPLREKTIQLRQNGKSYGEINKTLGVPKSTLSSWLANIPLSKEAQGKIKSKMNRGTIGLIKRNKRQTILAKKSADIIKENAEAEICSISDKDLLLIGAIMYWAEGYKRLKIKNGKEITSHVVGFTNSDPDMIYTFIIFLKRILNVPATKIFIELRLFKHMDSEKTINYWVGITGLSREQFKKPMYPVSGASQGKRPSDRLPYGTIRVIVSDTKLFYKIIGLINGVKSKIKSIK